MKFLRAQSTLLLVLAGMALSLTPLRLPHLSRELLFVVLLPPLLLEGAFALPWTGLKRDLPVISLLATLGVLISTLVVALGMHALLQWPWQSALLLGALTAATDPVAVLALFKQVPVPPRLRLLVEAESLLNDGTASLLFLVFAHEETSLPSHVLETLEVVLGSAFVGLLLGGLVLLVNRLLPNRWLLVALALLGACLPLVVVQASGVFVPLVMGHFLGNRLLPVQRLAAQKILENVAMAANAVVFLLLGAQLLGQLGQPSVVMLAAIGLTLLGRALAVYPLCLPFARTRMRVPRVQQHVLVWGGLRGALALALATEAGRDPGVLTATFAVVAFSVFVQGTTVAWVAPPVDELSPKP